MGMTAVCSGGCGYTAPSDSHRGGRLGNCPQCGKPMQGHTAGKAKGRYVCPVTGWVFTLGLGYSVQLEEPMRLVFVPGWDNDRFEDDPDRPGSRRRATYQRTAPTDREQKYLDRAAGRVFGPGCALDHDWTMPPTGSQWHGQAGVYLVPAPGADPAAWFVNEKVTYRKCAACPNKVVVSDRSRITEPWTPRRDVYYSGRRDRYGKPTNPGPHPAESFACRECDPRITDPEPF